MAGFGLFAGIGLIFAGFLGDVGKSMKMDRQTRLLNEYSHPECEWHIRYVKGHMADDQGHKVMDYCREHTYYDESIQRWRNCFPNDAIYDLAKAQCARHGVPWGEKEAWSLCPGARTNAFWTAQGLYK